MESMNLSPAHLVTTIATKGVIAPLENDATNRFGCCSLNK